MRQIFKKYILILLILSMVVTSFATTASAYSFASGSITVTNLHPNATIYYEHIIRPNTARETGWEIFPGLDNKGQGYDYYKSILRAFAEAYGFVYTDYVSTTHATETEEYIRFEQDVLKEVIADYDKTYADVNSEAISGTVNASEQFRKALQLANTYWIANRHGTAYADTNGVATVVNTSTNSDVALTQTGLYLIVPQSNEAYLYNPTAAFLGFKYENAVPNGHQSVTVKAKRISNIANKTAGAGCDSMSIGDTATYTITGLYPHFNAEYKDTAVYTVMDRSSQLEFDLNSIVVKVGDKTLTKGTEYTVIQKWDPAGFVVVLLDGDGSIQKESNGKAVEYNGSLPGYDSSNSGKVVTVTYSAKVTSLTTDGKVENTATISTNTGTDLDGDGKLDEPNWETKSVYISDTYEHRLVKTNDYDNEPQEFALAGAQFNVKDSSGKYITFTTTTESDGNYLIATVSGTSTTAQVITVPRGGVIFKGLDYDKTYTVTEVKAPDGYSLSSVPYVFSAATLELTIQTVTKQEKVNNVDTTTVTCKIVLANDTSSEATTSTVAMAKFKNTKLYDLPETGSIGTYVFTLVGVSIMASALLVFVSQRKETEV